VGVDGGELEAVALIALFVQRGTNEIIKGLEALDRKLSREPGGPRTTAAS
jgi:hypothetical protein